MVRMEPTAEASLAAMRERSRLGMAMAEMIRMMATTIRSSMREKPFWWVRILFDSLSAEACGCRRWRWSRSQWVLPDQREV